MNLFAVAYSPGGRFVAAAGDYNKPTEPRNVGLVKRWNARTGELWREFQLEGGAYFNVAFSRDGSRLAVAPFASGYGPELPVQQSIDVFSIESGQELVSLSGHSGTSAALAFAPGDNTLISVGEDNSIFTWKVQTGELVSTQPVDGRLSAAALTPEATTVITGSGHHDGRLIMQDVRSGSIVHEIEAKSGYGPHSVDVSDDGQLLVTSSQEEEIYIWEMNSGRQLFKLLSTDGIVFSVAFDPSSTRVVAGTDVGTALVWDLSAALAKAGFIEREEQDETVPVEPSEQRDPIEPVPDNLNARQGDSRDDGRGAAAPTVAGPRPLESALSY